MEGSDVDVLTMKEISTAIAKFNGDLKKETRHVATISQMSPLRMLQQLDETVTWQLEWYLTLDCYELFGRSLALLQELTKLLGFGMKERIEHLENGGLANLGLLLILSSNDFL